ISWSAADDVPEIVVGDPDRLGQVVVNLVANAIKFTERGSVRVYVTRAEGAPARELVLHFWVADTGVGIPASQQAEIFDAFSQGDAAQTMRTDGAGLGLPICSRLVRLMSGRIWVESELGGGSRFHFTAQLSPPRETTDEERDGEPAAPGVVTHLDEL